MSKLSGAVLILAGVAVGAFTLSSLYDTGTDVAAPPPADRVEKAVVITVEPPPPALQSEVTKVPAPQPVAKVAQPPPAALDRAALTKQIQHHLKRIGCYQGAIDGVWSPSVRRAMKAFTNRVNATLPIERADDILLAMLQNHEQVACGLACPVGQSLASDNRCVPNALVAHAGKRHAPPPSGSPQRKAPDNARQPTPDPAKVVAAPEALPPDGRMLLAGPRPEPSKAGNGLGQHKGPHSAAPRKRAAARDKSAGRGRYQDARARERRSAARYRVESTGFGFGFPQWGIPGVMP